MIQKQDIYSIEEIKAIVDKDDFISPEIEKRVVQEIGPAPQPPQQPSPEALQFVDQYRPGSSAMVMQKFRQSAQRFEMESQAYQKMAQTRQERYVYEQLMSIETGRYGIKIGLSASNATMRLALFQTMLEARKIGLMVPDDIIFETSDWPEKIKAKLAERMKQMQMQASAQPQKPQPAGRKKMA
jgi:hypothetical protein